MGEAKEKLESKKSEFEKNPENFINVHDCLLVVKREIKEGKSFYPIMNNCRSIEDVFMVEGFAKESLQNRRDQMRMMQAQKATQGIVVPGKTPGVGMPPMGGNGERKPFNLFKK